MRIKPRALFFSDFLLSGNNFYRMLVAVIYNRGYEVLVGLLHV